MHWLNSSDSDPERNIIYLTISAAELDPDFTLQANGNRLTFHGKSRAVSSKGTAADLESKDFQFDYELFGEVEEVRRGLTGKGVQVVLRKKELSDEYWPRLTKEKGKNSRITTDWSKWVDEDEQDGEPAADVSLSSLRPFRHRVFAHPSSPIAPRRMTLAPEACPLVWAAWAARAACPEWAEPVAWYVVAPHSRRTG